MSFQHPVKVQIDKMARLINELHHAYNIYFQGEERFPPLAKRKMLDELVTQIRGEVSRANQSAVTFLFRQTDSRYQMFKNKWDKKMAEIENGTYRIPVKEKRPLPKRPKPSGGDPKK